MTINVMTISTMFVITHDIDRENKRHRVCTVHNGLVVEGKWCDFPLEGEEGDECSIASLPTPGRLFEAAVDPSGKGLWASVARR